MPNQGRGFIAGEPPVALLAFRGKGNAHGPPVKTFLGMVIDRCPQRLEIPPRAAFVAAMPGVRQAGVGIDLRQHLAAPEFVEAADPGRDLELIAGFPDIREIDLEDVSAVDLLNVPVTACRLVFPGDVVG